VLWGIQATVDRTYGAGDDIAQLAKRWSDEEIFKDVAPELHRFLYAVSTTGLSGDRTFNLPEEDPRSLTAISRIREELEGRPRPSQHAQGASRQQEAGEQGQTTQAATSPRRTYVPHEQIGGDPAIGALRAYRLGPGGNSGELPHVEYVGLLPATVADYIRDYKDDCPELELVFNQRNCVPLEEHPQTISIESRHKIIISYGPGRRVGYLHRNGDFTDYLAKLRQVAREYEDGRIVVALSIPWPLDLGAELLKAVKHEFRDRGRVFVAVKSFRRGGTELDAGRAIEVYEKILSQADIISCNETELDDLDTAVVRGDRGYEEIPLPYKLKRLPLKAIKICHAGEGAILQVGCDPQRIVTSGDFADDPGKFLRESLQLATDGATYAIDSIEQEGRMASEPMVRVYSSSIEHRCEDMFRTTFLQTVERMPGGVVAVKAPLVARRLGAVTGAGAMFDALLLSFLMRD
jgi:hypothetical protein